MKRALQFIGSITIAVPLLVAIAAVLAWGTIYEARFGTAAVQQTVYRSWWFAGLLAFLAVNLAVAALERYPWQRRHLPFVLAHIGIILILVGGILGGRWGIEGQLIIPEGEAQRTLRLPQHVLVVRQRNPGVEHVIPTRFEATAWIHEPHAVFHVPLERGPVELTVDRYEPDAEISERIVEGGDAGHPALHLIVSQDDHQDETWLLADDPARSAAEWQGLHAMFLNPRTVAERQQLLDGRKADPSDRGVVTVDVPALGVRRDMPVPKRFGQPVKVDGTPYAITFKDYFPDFAITPRGVGTRSDRPNNPAVSLVVSGPEGSDVHLLFALHPEFAATHGRRHTLPVTLQHLHPAATRLPPNGVVFLSTASQTLMAMLTGPSGERTSIDPVVIGQRYVHPSLGYGMQVTQYLPRATVVREFISRSDDVKAEALHVTVRDGERSAERWVSFEDPVELPWGSDPLTLEYRPATRELPYTIKLLDFRKIDYPGTDMASGFESDVELTDPQRGMILMRTIKMNHPLRYRGFSFFQSSYLDGPTQTTILSVRNDPGTPFVYTGFVIVIAGIVSLFIWGSKRPQ